MNKTAAGALSAVLLAIGLAGLALGEDKGLPDGPQGWYSRGRDFAPVDNESYRTECGGCHFAYPPGLLPADAWRRLMGGLESHFGDDATLDAPVAANLLAYVTANSADNGYSIRSRAFAAKPMPPDKPPRITQTAYFQRKHSEIPPRLVKDNQKVKSFSHCSACHQEAGKGNFNAHQVSIPGVGRWED